MDELWREETPEEEVVREFHDLCRVKIRENPDILEQSLQAKDSKEDIQRYMLEARDNWGMEWTPQEAEAYLDLLIEGLITVSE